MNLNCTVLKRPPNSLTPSGLHPVFDIRISLSFPDQIPTLADVRGSKQGVRSGGHRTALVALLLAAACLFVHGEQPPKDLADNPEAWRELVRGEEAGSSPLYEFQYATPEGKALSRRFVIFLRHELDGGVPLYSEIVATTVRNKEAEVTAERVFRDVSVLGLRASRLAALSEREFRAIFLAKGLF